MRAEHHYRPLALVLSQHGDERDRGCRLLSEKGYNVLGFADAESTAAWLEEETPEVAIVDMPVDPRQHDILETLARRGVMLIPPV
jgi:DNA-binding NtrC family response regulator